MAGIDLRLGLVRHGPLQPFPGDKISIGGIGTAETVEGFERAQHPVENNEAQDNADQADDDVQPSERRSDKPRVMASVLSESA